MNAEYIFPLIASVASCLMLIGFGIAFFSGAWGSGERF